MSDKIVFKPVYGESRLIDEYQKSAGQLFFETDTGKIYLDVNDNDRALMGGTSLYYSSQGDVGDEIVQINGYYNLRKDSLEIDPTAILKAGDLIVGADGSFYRIVTSDSYNYLCNRMTIGSTGGGASVFYSEQEKIDADEEHEGFFILNANEVLVGDGRIKEDDLIIGLDNAFYRISEILENNELRCIRLAIAGGGGGGQAVSPRAKIYLNEEDLSTQYLINGKSASIRVWAESGKDQDDGEYLDKNLIVHWTLSEKPLGQNNYQQYSQGNFPITASTKENPV